MQPSIAWLKHELDMVVTSDPLHGEIYIPYIFMLDRDHSIYIIYKGWWYVGRPTAEEIRMDYRDLMSRRPDWAYRPEIVENLSPVAK